MHEVSVMSSIVEAVLTELRKYEIESVEEVYLTVGEMTYLGAEQLEFAYEFLTQGTLLEGSKLVIEPEKITVKCSTCGYEGGIKYLGDEEEDGVYHTQLPVISCPECAGQVEVVNGRSCVVKSVKAVEKDV
ncbi:hydrogenase maturation nickel metallochaperone HypA [Candidatus Methanomassiliicoccus intestinalis]|uniref:hydrogenase maturation nickel metallochaperone HypA n=1 Tax=Candidatus Methanomassiliicoccus intestinalis TaxID=1406512 RepID=UPI0037DC6F61